MAQEPSGAGGPPVIAFVGGGASATLTAVALLRVTTWLRLRYRLVLFDEHGRHGPGATYSGTEPRPVEAPAKVMSALSDRPAHLVEWARRHSLPCDPDTYLTRHAYGDYLAETLAETAAWAAPHATLECRTARVAALAADRAAAGVAVGLAGAGTETSRAVVIATGTTPLDPDPFVRGLLAAGLARPNPDGTGLDTCPCGALISPSGDVNHHLFAVGAVRRERAGTTPLPTIRDQAERVGQLIADVVLRDRPTAASSPPQPA